MAYLKDLPVRELKIDRSFVMDTHDHAANRVIVNSIVSLAQNLGLRVVAEGVEHQEAWSELSRLGWDALMAPFTPGTERPPCGPKNT